jgi:hypothetical protein
MPPSALLSCGRGGGLQVRAVVVVVGPAEGRRVQPVEQVRVVDAVRQGVGDLGCGLVTVEPGDARDGTGSGEVGELTPHGVGDGRRSTEDDDPVRVQSLEGGDGGGR